MAPDFDRHAGGSRWVGIGTVLLLHALALWGLWSHRLLPVPAAATTLFVEMIAPLSPPKPEPARREPEQVRPADVPPPRALPQPLVAQAPASSPSEPVAAPPPAPVAIAPPAQAAPVATGPVALGAELSVTCPDRPPPAYPALSRRKGEAGNVVLRVELDEHGQVVAAHIVSSSGHGRLDEAAMTAVRSWRCKPAQRNGQPIRALALQPFDFVLQGN